VKNLALVTQFGRNFGTAVLPDSFRARKQRNQRLVILPFFYRDPALFSQLRGARMVIGAK
jgi:hypothetical protein